MPSAGVIGITPDQAVGRTLRIGLAAAGTEARVVTSANELPTGEIDADLVLYQQVGPDVRALQDLSARLKGTASVIALVPLEDLASAVTAMKAHERVVGAMRVDRLTTHEISAAAARLVHGDLFGVEKVLPWGTRVHSMMVGAYDEKERAMQQISEFAGSVGVRRKYRERIERCCDEMVMNALYDAPVGRDGVPVAQKSSRRSRITLPPEDKALLEYGCDGRRFAVGVRDRFGRFERSVLLRYLDKCLHAVQQIDDKAGGGAGLGLYFISRSASSVLFNLLPGVATECVCTFDVEAAQVELEQIAVFHERVDEAGRLLPGPPRVGRHPVERRRGSRSRQRPEALVVPDPDPTDDAPTVIDQTVDRPDRGRPFPFGLVILILLALIGGVVAVVTVPGLAGELTDRTQEPLLDPTEEPSATRSPAASQGATAPTPGAQVTAGGLLTVSANVPGTITVRGRPECSGKALPLEQCLLSRGAHEVTLENPAIGLRHTFTVTIDRPQVRSDLRFGFVEARRGYLVAPPGTSAPQRRIAMPEGRQAVELSKSGKRTSLKMTVPVTADRAILLP